MTTTIIQRTRDTLNQLRDELLAERTEGQYWTGTLSPSALSTATAVSAMSAVLIHASGSENRDRLVQCIAAGIAYLQHQQNEDGGFGDTDRSHSNIATSYLVLAASDLAGQAINQPLDTEKFEKLNRYIDRLGKTGALKKRYGKDKTFVVPIMTNMAIAGLVPWNEVAALPFEAAVFPQSMYRLLQMPVVSYAIPALVAIGQTRHFHGPQAFFLVRWIRAASINRTMQVLERMQPHSGGYLEATPLTSFVVMSLAVTKRSDHKVAQQGLDFLVDSMNDDGSWPIDTNLATWVTSLAINALRSDPDDDQQWCTDALVQWHLSCQHQQRHPFTGAEPGGWGWSDLSGAVPDSDDTPAAILALENISEHVNHTQLARCKIAVEAGRVWLRKLQNRDGGWPTFCRGWGKLPFDRSSNDLTAHALRALVTGCDSDADMKSDRSVDAGIRFLERNQQPDGSWLPLWFGNQDHSDELNPVYGTSRVLLAAAAELLSSQSTNAGCQYLLNTQNEDGGWGGGESVAVWLKKNGDPEFEGTSSVEETALAVEALVSVALSERNSTPEPGVEATNGDKIIGTECVNSPAQPLHGGTKASSEAIISGVEFLLNSVTEQRHRVPWPIGFYFAKLWYHERLYPLIFTMSALGKYLQVAADQPTLAGSVNKTNPLQNPPRTPPEV